MTIDELRQTLREVLNTGQLGTPVAVRLSAQVADTQTTPLQVMCRCMELCGEALADAPLRLSAACTSDQRQLSMLVQHAGGQTTSATAGIGQSADSLQLLVVGSRGVARLEGGDGFVAEHGVSEPAGALEFWSRGVTESLAHGGFVPLTVANPG